LTVFLVKENTSTVGIAQSDLPLRRWIYLYIKRPFDKRTTEWRTE
jgi:hypothetical protein